MSGFQSILFSNPLWNSYWREPTNQPTNLDLKPTAYKRKATISTM